ncbi:uncharacterized protein wu:fc17b08 isoform X3 [Trematomus bernacchii]|uniref:uncharacterized protein wu:fc17b08 isoform X2 n=1 Tax=Trematomus bernacchii TaxID=40690 RepID=UPI00146ED528|nr:uncharacterized protein wu:fc17b08 isoform X2 [Trematomus bernacchii]XP_034008428.1 uncharacterized protein wu:fc17b08 isoform X3 [Trematomus bernacchii]
MASQCKRQQCTIDRRGFRQELDSWKHKLIHCVGFESILEGLFTPGLKEDLQLFKDLEPTAVSDWSFDENCLFCCLRRDNVKEHLIGLTNEGIEDTPKPLLAKDQNTISRLEKQAEEFLHAVLGRKDVPNFSDPNIPVVAREILQRMMRQFAAEYTSKNISSQDSGSDSQPCSDQSLPTPSLISGASPPASPAATVAGPAHNQNPVLIKLLMADQEAPLDLTIKRPPSLPTEQDGVLDLSVKKNRYSSGSLSDRSPCLSPATSTLKGESQDFPIAKATDLQSTSTLERFMAKLCTQHQRQIVDAIGFLQTEVKALASSNTQNVSNSPSGIQGSACSTSKSNELTPKKSCPELKFPSESTPKSEVQDMSYSIPSIHAIGKVPNNAVLLKTSTGPALDLRTPGSGSNQALVTPTANPLDSENNRHGDHAPLKMKIMASNVAAGKKLSCVLNASLSSQSDTLEDRQGNSNSSNRTESARLSSSMKRHTQTSHAHHVRQRDSLGHAKDKQANLFSLHMSIPSDSPRTARKTVRSSSDHGIRDSTCKALTDPDLGLCDIVFIDKPITECFKEQRRGMLPRRNARKSTRGHLYSDEIWELKTVRTLAGRGNCPNPMPDMITLVTPKQMLSKPEGVPYVDMPFAGAGRETMSQQMSREVSNESVIPGTGDMVEVAASEEDVIVEHSQTDRCQSKEQLVPSSLMRSPKENIEMNMNTDVEMDTSADSVETTGIEKLVSQAPFEAEPFNEHEPQEDMHESPEQIATETVVGPLEDNITNEDEPQLSLDGLHNSEPVLKQISAPSPVAQVEEEINENKGEEIQDEKSQDLQPETEKHNDNFNVIEKSNITDLAAEPVDKELEMNTSEATDCVVPLETEGDNDEDVSTKSLDALSKELPPWRRKKGTAASPSKLIREADAVVVGFVNGRPISASDRSLRRRSNNATSPTKTPVKTSQNVDIKTLVDSAVENKHSEEHLAETDIAVKSIDTTPEIQKDKEPSSAPPSSPTSTFPPKTKLTRKQKRDKDGLSVLSEQRQLRSKGTPVSPPESKAAISSPKPTATHALPSTETLPCLPLPSSLPVTSPPPIESSSPEQSKKNTVPVPETLAEDNIDNTVPVPETLAEDNIDNTVPVPETLAEDNIDNSQQEETTPEEIQNIIEENTSQANEKPPSTNAVVESSENEKQPLVVSSPLKIESPVTTEMPTQITPITSKRVLRKEAQASDVALPQKSNVEPLGDKSASGDESSSDKPARMPLRSESKIEMPPTITHSSPVDNKKLALRSQRLAVPSTSATVAGRQTDLASPIRIIPEKATKAQMKPLSVAVVPEFPQSSALPINTPRSQPPKQTNRFLENLNGEENQHLITNLNIKYDKMQKGWVQLDKEGQPATKYKNKSDRQAAIWKSKRRARKSKSSDHQKYSPFQMLFVKGFNLSSICHWYLETTETKSLVIVKKVNTRLPSETQLCFHSASSSGASQGIFPSLQAERLKKHLKKFAIASPVKSNPKSQKLIARALEANAVKVKERGELPSSTQTAKACAQGESQKASGKSKNPASARILKKYSNIREKMQVQQTNVRLKEASKTLKNNNMKKLDTKKSAAKSNVKPSTKAQRSALPVGKKMKASAAKMERRKTLAGRKTTKPPVQQRAVKAQGSSRASRDATKKVKMPKRSSQRLGSPKVSGHNPGDKSKSKADNKKQTEAERVDVEKAPLNKVSPSKTLAKETSQSTVAVIKGAEKADETPRPSVDGKAPTSPDQVLTRSQRKMEVAVPLSGGPSQAAKKAAKSMKTQNASSKAVKKSERPMLMRRGAKGRQTAVLPRSVTKSATKRAREPLKTPAKRTRTSLSK